MVYKIEGVTKDYIWGGKRLNDFGYGGDRIAEAWVLSFHKDGMSKTDGKPVAEVLPRSMWGTRCDKFKDFPLLIKLIDAKSDLSVQVHPSDEYALKNEGQYGKTEMWYVIDADEGAGLYVGFNRDLTKRQFEKAIADDSLSELLNFYPVKSGDCFFIESGTIHAIGKGCLIAEVQQNSNLTYRVYDYGRVGADGKPRELHTKKALEVTDLKRFEAKKFDGLLAECEYFKVRLTESGERIYCDDSFTSVLMLSDGAIDSVSAKRGESYFIPAGVAAQVRGRALITTV